VTRRIVASPLIVVRPCRLTGCSSSRRSAGRCRPSRRPPRGRPRGARDRRRRGGRLGGHDRLRPVRRPVSVPGQHAACRHWSWPRFACDHPARAARDCGVHARPPAVAGPSDVRHGAAGHRADGRYVLQPAGGGRCVRGAEEAYGVTQESGQIGRGPVAAGPRPVDYQAIAPTPSCPPCYLNRRE
jgi:hypothetical protein